MKERERQERRRETSIASRPHIPQPWEPVTVMLNMFSCSTDIFGMKSASKIFSVVG